jgi:hypothetical protein
MAMFSNKMIPKEQHIILGKELPSLLGNRRKWRRAGGRGHSLGEECNGKSGARAWNGGERQWAKGSTVDT